MAYEAEGRPIRLQLPIIQRRGRADGGHAVALVGYTRQGFVVQNSWGKRWGYNGFALLPYEDFLLHATDVWAAQIGVPLALDLWSAQGAADTTKGLARSRKAVPLDEIRPYIIDVGNDGKLSQRGNYWTTEEDMKRLFRETIPLAAQAWPKRRVLLYLHGGLNSEADVAGRVVALRDVMLANHIYPLHIMWESGAAETLRHIVDDILGGIFSRAGGFMDTVRNIADEGRDRSLELTTARIGGAMWREMTENARLASNREDGNGAMQIALDAVEHELTQTQPGEAARWELHIVAHSAGAIYLAHALQRLLASGIPVKSVQLMAPAMTIDLFREHMFAPISSGACPAPRTYILSDEAERDDTVGPYGKSLLYLVSNAFEKSRGQPLLSRIVRTNGS